MGEMADYYMEFQLEDDWSRRAARRLAQNAPRGGQVWGRWEDVQLRRMRQSGMDMPAMAAALGRTLYAVECRLEHLRITDAAQNLQPAKKLTTKEKDVNLTHLLTLLQDDYTTVKVVFKDGGSPYTYKIQKSVAVKPMDRVVVYAEDQLKIATVFSVDEEPDVDLSAPYTLKWVVQVVDLTHYDEQVQHEVAALQHLKKLNNAKKRDELLKTLFGGSEGLEEVKALLKGPN